MRSQVLDIFQTSQAADLLYKLNFDIRKYSKANFNFLMTDLNMFLHGLNKNYSIYDSFEQLNSIDIMCFFEPWLIRFLEKVLEKKQSNGKFLEKP